MAPSRKEQYEKNAWSWVENCSPLEVTDEHIRTAYRVNFSRCKVGACRRNCRGNPFCLSNLGEHKWLGNHEDFINDQVNDPEKERRKPGSYVGLKNLGATCYVNSLLQLWFHNLNFRKAIFMWDPLQDPEEKQNITIQEEKYIPFSVLGHLQAVFALMQYGHRRYVDPTDFISSLRLDTSIQQDAQEFSKLFLSKLETVLSYQSVKEVRDLIKDNFCGEYSYVTRCMKCKMESKQPSKFYELDLNIKGHKTIQDCLKEFIYIEMLEGDDKYFCQVCGEKQDAQRFISLTELPPVLNLQLMRFVFDKNTGYKKKLNTFVQFPDKLDMAEFCPKVKGNLEYTLSAVLVHGGRSANSGHYVAHICDSESGTWYKFNDESVEKIEGKKLKLGTEDEYEDGGKKVKIPRAPKGSYHSLNAYMLVYTRNDIIPAPSSTENKQIEWNLPPHLQNFIDDQNLQFENWVIDMKNTNDATVGRSQNQQIEMATNITLLSVDIDSDNFEAVPTVWLTGWLSDPDDDHIIENDKYTCNHGKLDPSEVTNIKYINSEVAEKLFDKYGGDRRLKYNEFECRSCVVRKCFQIRVKNKTQNEVKIITNKLRSKLNESEPAYWVGKTSLRSWRRLALENLENGLLDYNCMEILNDTPIKSYKYENRELPEKECNHNSECGDRNGKNIYRTSNGDHKSMEIDETGDSKSVNDVRYNSNARYSPYIASKLDECIALSSESVDGNMIKINNHLKDIINYLKNPHEFFDSEDSKNVKIKSKNDSKTDDKSIVSSYTGAFYNFLQNREKTFEINDTCAEENARQNCMAEPSVDESSEHDDKHYDSSHKESPIHQNDEPKVIPCAEINSEIETLPNGDVEPGKAKSIDNEDESSTSETRFNEDLLCVHGNLCVEENNRRLVPEEVWRMLKKYFPNVNEFTSDASPCGDCKSYAKEKEVEKGLYRNEAARQKECLLDLFLDRNRPQFKPNHNESENTFYVVNKEFINSWRKFIRENGKKPPPYYIKNQSLLCEDHSGLLYDLNIDVPNTIVLVTAEEWEQLKKTREREQCEISVRCAEDGSIVSKPEVCYPCMCSRMENEEKAQLCYSKAKIYIKVQNDEEFDSLPNEDLRPLPAKRARLASVTKNPTTCNLNGTSNCGSATNNNVNTNVTAGDNAIVNGDPTWSNAISSSVSEMEISDEVCSNGAIGSATSSCNGPVNGKVTANGATVNGNGLPVDSVGVRRSSRCRGKVRGTKELIVSSDLTLLDVKKKICEMMSVAPMDQHLSTSDGRILTENTATLTELSIYPDSVLNLKVDEPCDGVIADDFIASREPEAGFKGTSLVGS